MNAQIHMRRYPVPPLDIHARLTRMTAAAEPFIGARAAEELARNLCMTLPSAGDAALETVANSVQYRRTVRVIGRELLDMSDETAERLAAAVAAAWEG